MSSVYTIDAKLGNLPHFSNNLNDLRLSINKIPQNDIDDLIQNVSR